MFKHSDCIVNTWVKVNKLTFLTSIKTIKNNNFKKWFYKRGKIDVKVERYLTNGHKEFKNKHNFMKKSLAKPCRNELKILCKIIAVRNEMKFFTQFFLGLYLH